MSVSVAAVALVAGCKREPAIVMRDAARKDTAVAVQREVVPPERVRAVDYQLTDERVQRWRMATANLERLALRDDDAAPTAEAQDEVDRAVRRLEREPRAVEAIESAGLSVYEYVVATVALRQAIAAADSPGDSLALAVPPSNVAYVLEQRGTPGTLVAEAEAEVPDMAGGAYGNESHELVDPIAQIEALARVAEREAMRILADEQRGRHRDIEAELQRLRRRLEREAARYAERYAEQYGERYPDRRSKRYRYERRGEPREERR